MAAYKQIADLGGNTAAINFSENSSFFLIIQILVSRAVTLHKGLHFIQGVESKFKTRTPLLFLFQFITSLVDENIYRLNQKS